MKPILSALFISSILIIFFSFLTAKIDQSVRWSWFVVFVPLFLLNFCFMIDGFLLTIRSRLTSSQKTKKYILIQFCNLLMTAFEVMLCLKLDQYYSKLKLVYVFIPIWTVAFILVSYFIYKLSR